MKPGAVIAALWQQNAALVRELVDVLEDDVYVFRGLGLSDDLPGIQFVEDALDPASDLERRESAQHRAAAIGSHVEATDWEIASPNLALGGAAIRHALLDDLPHSLWQAMTLVDTCDALARSRRIDLLVVNEDETMFGRTLALWSRSRGIRSVHVTHACNFHRLESVFDTTFTDAITVFGPRGARCFQSAGVAADRIRPLGNPHWDEYALSLLPNRDATKRRLGETYGFDPSAPLVLFGTVWMPYLTANEDVDAYESTLRAFLRTVKALRDRLGIVWVVKDRAMGNRNRVDALIAEEGLPPGAIVYATDDVRPFVASADVVVSSASNLSIEAAYCGAVPINLFAAYDWLPGPPFDASDGILEVLPEELTSTLWRLFADDGERARRAEDAHACVSRFSADCGGSAARRQAEFIASLVGGTYPRRVL